MKRYEYYAYDKITYSFNLCLYKREMVKINDRIYYKIPMDESVVNYLKPLIYIDDEILKLRNGCVFIAFLSHIKLYTQHIKICYDCLTKLYIREVGDSIDVYNTEHFFTYYNLTNRVINCKNTSAFITSPSLRAHRKTKLKYILHEQI